MTLEFGFSPCPNDTFMFWGWVHHHIRASLTLSPQLLDIQALNELALGPTPLALTKVSAATYLKPVIQERYQLLTVGAALGRGCGPLLVSYHPWTNSGKAARTVAIPGWDTTACRLAQAALSDSNLTWVQRPYHEIMPAVHAQEVDAGVIIHESRFTYQQYGLHLAFDLGSWWEQHTGLPLPLGVMVAHRHLPQATIHAVESYLRESLRLAMETIKSDSNSALCRDLWSYLRRHAIEMEESTMARHIELYVNAFSLDLGREGLEALNRLESLSYKK